VGHPSKFVGVGAKAIPGIGSAISAFGILNDGYSAYRGISNMHGGKIMAEANSTEPPNVFSKKWLLVVIFCGAIPFLLFAFLLGDPGRGRAAAICTAVIMYAVRGNWDLRKYTWFRVILEPIS
jgi:hypothetical protein